MLALLTDYIRTIVFFLIFSSFIGIILPSGKYKNYISIMLGFILLFIVVEPVTALDETGLNQLVEKISEQIDMETSEVRKTASIRDYEELQEDLLGKNFSIQLQSQIAVRIAPLGYSVQRLDTDANFETGTINRLELWIRKGDGKIVKDENSTDNSNIAKNIEIKNIEIKNINIEAIEIKDTESPILDVTNNIETEEIEKIKNVLSDFYNISNDNIHINTMK